MCHHTHSRVSQTQESVNNLFSLFPFFSFSKKKYFKTLYCILSQIDASSSNQIFIENNNNKGYYSNNKKIGRV